MIGQAYTSEKAPQEVISALNILRERLEREVLAKHLGVELGKFGPAEFLVPRTQLALSEAHFVHYTLTGVTEKQGRNFTKALPALESVITDVIMTRWRGGGPIQLMVVIESLDPHSGKVTHHESKPIVLDM